MKTRRHHIRFGMAAVALSGIATMALAADSGAQIALGQDLAGEECHSVGTASAAQSLPITCGASMSAGGTLWVAANPVALPEDQGARRQSILRVAKTVPGGLGATGQVTCDGGQWFDDAGDRDSALFLCTVEANGWPRIVLVSQLNGNLYEAEGPPALLPVLHAAIAKASGRAMRPAVLDSSSRLLAAKIPASVLRSGATEYANFSQLADLGRAYSGADNFAGAEAAYRGALEVETKLFGADAIAVGNTLLELALQVSNQRRFDEAGALFRRATPIVAGSTSTRLRARLASYQALDAANQRRFADALTYAEAATALRRAEVDGGAPGAGGVVGVTSTEAPVSKGELAHSLRIEAEMALRLDDPVRARGAAEEALWIISQEDDLPLWWRPDIVSLIAEINERDGRVAEAESQFRGALALDRKIFGDSAPTALMELRIGRFYSDQQVYPASLASYRAALAILAKDPVARSEVLPDQIVPLIAAAVAISADPQQRSLLEPEIFRASQLVNSDVADQTIARAAASQAAGNPALSDLVHQSQDAKVRRDNLRMDLAAEYAKPDDQRSAEQETRLAEQVRLASLQADQALAKVQQAFPDYSRFSDPGPAELSLVQSHLQPGEGFLSFVMGEKGSFALLVTSRGLTVTHIDETSAQLAVDVSDLRSGLVLQLGAPPDFSLVASHGLYNRLLAPLEPDLGGIDHLIVASTGDLASLPFALLVTEAPRNGAEHAYSEAAWLVRRMALSQIPSPRAFVTLRDAQQRRVPAPKPFLGVGNPNFLGSRNGANALGALSASCRGDGPISPELLRELLPLPDTAAELGTVAKALGGDADSVLLGAEATEGNLRSHQLDQYAVLYFATHGLLPGELRCQAEPGIVLSPPAAPAVTAEMDGLLGVSEISVLKLDADLVVLSACNTAAEGGGRFGGGALEGVADAFFNAGARAVLASHWDVPSVATTRLMINVFGHLGPDRSRNLAEALRQAQLDLIAQPAMAHPVNWAAFTIIGGGAAL